MSSLLAYRKTTPWHEDETIFVNGMELCYEPRQPRVSAEDVVVRLYGGIRLSVSQLRLMGARISLPLKWLESDYQ